MALSRNKAAKELEEAKKVERLLNLKIVQPGDAVNFPKHGDSIAVHYTGYLEDGTCFDNSYDRGQPVHFILGTNQVLKGWELAIPILSRGEKARITLPPDYGYGDKGYPPIIPPKAELTFEIELVSFSSVGNVERLAREKRYKRDKAIEEAGQLVLAKQQQLQQHSTQSKS